MEEATATEVLYLVGTTRCGSTLIGSLLGQVPGVVHVGELARIWEEGLLGNHVCGCGTRFRDCPFWQAVLDRAFGGPGGVDPRRMMDILTRSARVRHAPGLATAAGRRRLRERMTEYTEAVSRLYAAIRQVSGSRLVVDSSKAPLLAWIAGDRPDIDLSVLHVTRDPRAVMYSWQRRKFDPAKGEDMVSESTVKHSLFWLALNGVAASVWERRRRYLHVRYEDFTADPRAMLDRILAFVGLPAAARELISDDRRFASAPAHTISGNPMRFQKGPVAIAADTAWQEAAPMWDQVLVSSLTWPLLGKYHYPIVPALARKAR